MPSDVEVFLPLAAAREAVMPPLLLVAAAPRDTDRTHTHQESP